MLEKATKITRAILEKLDSEYLYGWDTGVDSLKDNEKWQYLAKHKDAISWIVFEELAGREPTDEERKELAK